ncbi:hypothetical protein M422DRAFT_63653 [Sphaerobolus stellatus SS14]|nr:hypothetical protein M422DRAFT_63653 [Sphaerobolus stellatus SS14]
MDDPWASNAWSTASTEEQYTSTKSPEPQKWNAFERDADEETADVAAPTWATASVEPVWDDGMGLWNSSTSDMDVWNASVPDVTPEEPEEQRELEEPERQLEYLATDTVEQEPEDTGAQTPTQILPTPPRSPLPISANLLSNPVEAEEAPEPEIAAPPSPDPFGSFESAELTVQEPADEYVAAWSPISPGFALEETEEPWGNAWEAERDEDTEESNEQADEWEAAQEAKRRRDRKVPPELLQSILDQWEKVSEEVYGKHDPIPPEFSWRKGLDNVEGLFDLVERFLPPPSYPPPTPLSKSMLAKSVKETLRLTRSFGLTQSSPMSRLYASKGSMEWEQSVRSQKHSAKDEWGWDLKHGHEEIPEHDSSTEKKTTSFLSFWGRKPSSTPSINSSAITIASPSLASTTPSVPESPLKPSSKASSPATSARPSVDISTPISVTKPTTPTTPQITVASTPSINEAASATPESPSVQPSAVSRFWSRFSKRSSTVAPTASTDKEKEKERRSSLQVALSANDISFLSDIVPAGTPAKSHQTVPSLSSLESMLSSSSTAGSSKLPPPLAPPPRPSALPSLTTKESGSARSSSSFDRAMADAQLMDALDAVGLGIGGETGYTPVSFDLLDSPMETPSVPIHTIPPLPISPPPPSQRQSIPAIPLNSALPSARPRSAIPSLAPSLPSPLQPPPGSLLGLPNDSSSQRDFSADLLSLSSLSSSTPPPAIQPSAGAIQPPAARVDNPLPPTPQTVADDFDDFADFISGPSLSSNPDPPSTQAFPHQTPTIPASSSPFGALGAHSAKAPHQSPLSTLSTPSPTMQIQGLLSQPDNSEFGDFGDFMSTPPPVLVSNRSRNSMPTAIPTLAPPPASSKSSVSKTSRLAPIDSMAGLVTLASNKVGRWPAPPSPGLPRLQLPPGPAGNNRNSSLVPSQHPSFDLFGDDFVTHGARHNGSDGSSHSGPTAPTDFSAVQQSAPSASTPAFNFTTLAASPTLQSFSSQPFSSQPSRTPTPLGAILSPQTTGKGSSGAGTKSGLSAQDLSFFEGL